MAEIKTPDKLIGEINKKYSKNFVEDYKLVYNSSSQTLEPIYFWILDLMNTSFQNDVTPFRAITHIVFVIEIPNFYDSG